MDISPQDINAWRKKIELIGIDIKSLEQDADPSRLMLKTKFMNRHFINELDKIGLQLINITGTYMGRLNVLLEAKDASSEDKQIHKTNRRHLEILLDWFPSSFIVYCFNVCKAVITA